MNVTMLILLSLLLIFVNNVFLFRDVNMLCICIYICICLYTDVYNIDPYVCMCHRLLVSVYIVCSTIVPILGCGWYVFTEFRRKQC